MNEVHYSTGQFTVQQAQILLDLQRVLFTQMKKSSVIVINSSLPPKNLLFIIFQNSIKDDLRRLFEARLMTTWAVHT